MLAFRVFWWIEAPIPKPIGAFDPKAQGAMEFSIPQQGSVSIFC